MKFRIAIITVLLTVFSVFASGDYKYPDPIKEIDSTVVKESLDFSYYKYLANHKDMVFLGLTDKEYRELIATIRALSIKKKLN